MSGSAELVLGTNGVNPDRKAAIVETFPLSEVGQYVQLRVTNTTGRLTVRGLSVEAQAGDRTTGTRTST